MCLADIDTAGQALQMWTVGGGYNSMLNPLPDDHAHKPSIWQHQQKIRKQSQEDYLMPRWWLSEVRMLHWGKVGSKGSNDTKWQGQVFLCTYGLDTLNGPFYFCLLKGFDHDRCHPDSRTCTSSWEFYDKSVNKYHCHIFKEINDLHCIW